MPTVGKTDDFEERYTAKLWSLMAGQGLRIEYNKDFAALDLGFHLYARTSDGEIETDERGDKKVSNVRIWMQCKGLQATSLTRDVAEEQGYALVKGLKTDHVAYWYAAPEPVYLVVYVEALDIFLAEDVRELVDRQLANTSLRDLAASQKTVTLRLPLASTLDVALAAMPQHRSIRVDGPQFRGRPLGHNLDPLRSEMNELPPEIFRQMVDDLLAAHEFSTSENIDASRIFASAVGELSVRTGTLLLTYEWTSPLFTEYGFDEGSSFRIESPPMHAQGEVVVIVHSRVEGRPTETAELTNAIAEWQERGVKQVLVFINQSDQPKIIGSWRVVLAPLCQVPQGMGSITFNVLTTTSVYLKYFDQLSWRTRNYL